MVTVITAGQAFKQGTAPWQLRCVANWNDREARGRPKQQRREMFAAARKLRANAKELAGMYERRAA